MKKEKTLLLKAYSVAELAVLYGVTSRTLKNWLTPYNDTIGKKYGRFYTVKQVATIFDKIGEPGDYTVTI